jgi:hypothetical protein
MYAYGKIEIERKDVWALPLKALMHLGDNTILRVGQRAFCWLYQDGRSSRFELETGVIGDPDPETGERWIEVTNRRVAGADTASSAGAAWTPIDGTEQVILGDLSILDEGGAVQVATEAGKAKGATTGKAPDRAPP